MTGHLQRSVITGIGALTPLALTMEETWRGLLDGRSGIGPITRFDASSLPVRIAGEVEGFDPLTVLSRKQVGRSARFAQLAVAASRQAIDDAGVDIDPENSDRIGVIMNSAVAGMGETAEAEEILRESGWRHVPPTFVASVIPNMAASHVSMALGIHGPVTAGALACASGNAAILDAARLIATGDADMVVAGGTDASISELMFSGLSTMGALSRNNDHPTEASRPFDAERDGFVYGEGAVALIVESEEHARARGARIYAEVLGGALTSDAFHIAAPHPYGTYAARAITGALHSARLAPSDVDYICAHGTSTKANDRTETMAIHLALQDAATRIPVSSPKSMVGHLIGSAGALSLAVCALAIRDKAVPPTINLEHPDPECDLDYVPGTARRVPVKVALANAFGFGGQNCVVALGAYTA